jgi:hypothetical protein
LGSRRLYQEEANLPFTAYISPRSKSSSTHTTSDDALYYFTSDYSVNELHQTIVPTIAHGLNHSAQMIMITKGLISSQKYAFAQIG